MEATTALWAAIAFAVAVALGIRIRESRSRHRGLVYPEMPYDQGHVIGVEH